MLEIRDLHKVYGKYHALNGLNMTVRDGALYGFVGPNGAGKTTTIKIMAGLLGADGGSVMIGGEDGLASPARLKKMIGYVPDFFGVYDNLTVSEYMEFFASCYNMDGLVARKRYTALLEQVGLEDRLDFYVDGLSRGMKQRLCLARALIHDPEILILDEPTSGLDPRTRFEFKEILKDLQESGRTIFICALRAVGALHGYRDTGPGKAGAGGQYPGYFDPGERLQSPGDFGLQQPGAGVKRAEKPPLRADHFPAGK